MKTLGQRVGLTFGVAAAVGLLAGIGSAVVAGAAGLIMGGLMLFGSRAEPDGGLRWALIISGITGLVVVALQLFGRSA